MTDNPSDYLATCAPETFRYVVYLRGDWQAFSSRRERVSQCFARNPEHQLLIQSGEPAMSSLFAIYNLQTKQITTTAPTPEGIEREYAYSDAYMKKRDMMQVICEIPTMFGLTIHNYREFPEQVILDGIALYGRRKAGS